MNATNCDSRRRVTFPPDLKPEAPVVIDTIIPGREWRVTVPANREAQSYSKGRIVKGGNGIYAWSGDVGVEPSDELLCHRAKDDRARE